MMLTVIDVSLAVVVSAGAVVGYKKGLIRQLAALVGVVAGLVVAKALYAQVAASYLTGLGLSASMSQVAAFLLIWTVVACLFIAVASLLSKAVGIIKLGWLDRCLGVCIGALKWGLAACLLIGALEMVDTEHRLLDKQTKERSVFYYPMCQMSAAFLPTVTGFASQLIQD